MIKITATHLVPSFSDYELTQIKSAKYYHPDWYKSVPNKMTGMKDNQGLILNVWNRHKKNIPHPQVETILSLMVICQPLKPSLYKCPQ